MNSVLKPARFCLKPDRRLSSTRTSALPWKCSTMWLPMNPAPPVTSARISESVHQFVHSHFLLFNGFHQFELGPAAVKVVSFATHFEIGVAHQKVSEKADADFKRYELSGKDE